jgi:type I restriction enzyme M protein
MNRADIITTVGRNYLEGNIENNEFSYQKGLASIGKNHTDYMLKTAKRQYKNVDLRFVEGNITILVETKQKLVKNKSANDMEQLQQYVIFEKELTGNKIIAILSGTVSDELLVWLDGSGIIDEEHRSLNERVIRPFKEYRNLLFGTKNDKLAIIQNTYALNELLHGYGIIEKIRSQFVGTCLLALKNGLVFEGLSTKQVRAGIETVLEKLLDDLNKAEKLVILKNKVIDSQSVRELKDIEFQEVLRYIQKNILPYINETSTQGQDLLNLFFTTFNKYVGKSDKNQAFTPDHIVDVMCKVVGVNRHSIVLDPCCGSGAFLVRALTDALDDCDTEEERTQIKKKQIYGIESDETAFGLSTTNMLIHGDGNSNIIQGNCFIRDDYKDSNVSVVLMNPPYNATRRDCEPNYVKTWKKKTKEDPSKGFHFVYEIAKKVKHGRLAALLPMQCAIGSSSDIQQFKKKMLEEHTLDAVFSFPSDMFHPGASAIACCMVFNLGTRHESAPIKETFFGYFKDDGFTKRKNLGRVERQEGIWVGIKEKWLDLYFGRRVEIGLSAVKKVTANDEWLAEAYMETDYSKLSDSDFEKSIRDYYSYLVKNGDMNDV